MANLTKYEYNLLEADLQRALSKREEARTRLAEASKQGDISENAEFDAAKADITMYSNTIQNIQRNLKSAKIIPTWRFKLRMSADGYPEQTAVFNIILTETTVRAIPLFKSDSVQGTSVFSSGENNSEECGMVTTQSKLGSFLSKFTSADSINATFKYIDNKQVARTFTILEAVKETAD